MNRDADAGSQNDEAGYEGGDVVEVGLRNKQDHRNSDQVRNDRIKEGVMAKQLHFELAENQVAHAAQECQIGQND